MSDTGTALSVWTGLLPVLVGGAIGILGGMIGPYFIQHAKDATDRKRKRAEKFEELVTALYEHRHWLDTLEDIRVFGADLRAAVSPFAKVQAISAVHFQNFAPALAELDALGRKYEAWMSKAAVKRLEHPTALPNTDGLIDVYGPYNEKFWVILADLRDFARREFR
jgi:hypothetical protein